MYYIGVHIAPWGEAATRGDQTVMHSFAKLLWTLLFNQLIFFSYFRPAHMHYIKGKGFPYSLLSVGPGADPGVQSVSLQVTL